MRGRVAWVVDGDAIHVQIGKHLERVRDIGVNAPEIPHAVRGGQHGGEQARAINRRLVARHAVRLELDLVHRDSRGRLVAYAWVRRAKKSPSRFTAPLAGPLAAVGRKPVDTAPASADPRADRATRVAPHLSRRTGSEGDEKARATQRRRL